MFCSTLDQAISKSNIDIRHNFFITNIVYYLIWPNVRATSKILNPIDTRHHFPSREGENKT